MRESDIILVLMSFTGIAGSLLGFFLYPLSFIRDRPYTSRILLFIALLFWLAVSMSLFHIKVYIKGGTETLLLVAYWATLVGSLFALFLIFLWNLLNTFLPPIRQITKELKWEREAIKQSLDNGRGKQLTEFE